MTKVIIGTQGRINALLSAINEFEFVSAAPFGDGKVMIVVKGEAGDHLIEAGEPIIKEVIKEIEVEVIKEVIKEVEVIKDNPEIVKQLVACQKENKALKTQNAKLKKALEAI